MIPNDLFRGHGVRIELTADFNIVRETLTRLGVKSKKTSTLFQTAHILHKKGEYAILHFKELFQMDGRETDIEPTDLHRRNTIVELLEMWKLVKSLQPIEEKVPIGHIGILKHDELKDWKLVSKYQVGVKHF